MLKHPPSLAVLVGALFFASTAVAQDTHLDNSSGHKNAAHMQAMQGPPTPFAELIGEAISEHPSVRARRAAVDIEQARLGGVGLRPDPMVSLSAMSIPWSSPGFTSTSMSGISLGVSQPLWWPGELDALKEQVVAQSSALKPAVDEATVELEVDAVKLFYEIYEIDRSVEVLGELKAPLNQLIDLLKARISTGEASIAQVERARMELLGIDDRILSLVHGRMGKVAELNALLNRAPNSPIRPPSQAPVYLMPFPDQTQPEEPLKFLDELVERGMKNRPVVRALEAQKKAASAGASAAKWQDYPRLEVFGSWKFRFAGDDPMSDGPMGDGTDFFSLGVRSTLPIWSGAKKDSAKDVATSKIVKIDADIATFRIKLRRKIAAQLAMLHHLNAHISYERDTLIPQARRVRKASKAGLSVGKADYESWLRAEQRLVQLRVKLVERKADIRKYNAMILALIGELPVQATRPSNRPSTDASAHPSNQTTTPAQSGGPQ